jgi:hypothetical protein
MIRFQLVLVVPKAVNKRPSFDCETPIEHLRGREAAEQLTLPLAYTDLRRQLLRNPEESEPHALHPTHRIDRSVSLSAFGYLIS